MNAKEKKGFISTYLNSSWILFSAIVVLLFLFLLLGELFLGDERDKYPANCHVFESQWYQVLENGETIAVDVPGKLPAKYGEVITLTTTLPTDLSGKEDICFHAIWQDVDIFIDGQLRQSYNTEDSRLFGSNSPFRFIFVELQASDAGKELCYQFSSNSKYAGDMRTSYIGDRTSIWLYLAQESSTRAVVSVFLLFLSLFCIVTCFILKLVYKRDWPLSHLAWTVFFAALWMFSEVSFRQILIKNVSVFTNFTYWSLMMFPFPLIRYVNDAQKGTYEKLYAIPVTYSIILLVGGTVLQFLDIVQFVQQLFYIHIGSALAILSIIVTITIDTFKKRISDYLFVGIGIYGLLLSAVVEIVLYYVSFDISLGTVLAFGLLFLLIMAIFKTGQDLFRTEQKKQKAVAAQEAQAKFLANMSHEIRTPINVVIGMNEMILRESQNETVQEYAHNIQSASNMLLGLVNDVLDFSKIESGQFELVEDTYTLSALIHDELLILNNRIGEKPILSHTDIDPALPSKFRGDELRIRQIVTNLVSNAVKYTKEGSITLKVFSQSLEEDTLMLSFSIIDTGSGIREEDMPKLFNSFKRLELNKNRNIEGTGLGLNIAKQLAELMKGTVSVESKYGSGSTFTLSIPQKIMDEKPIGSLENALRTYRKETEAPSTFFTAPEASVLIVDDNAMNLTLMKGLLKRTKIQVDLAKSGAECLALAKEKTYHLILLDHMMPEMDGVETLQLLRSDKTGPNRNTPVIALTANAIAGCREMYLENGFHDYFSKPIQTDKLDALLMQYLPSELIIPPTIPSTKMDSES